MSWPDASAEDRKAGASLAETIERIKWRLWHGQLRRGLDLIAETMATLEATTETASPVTLKVTRLLDELETYVCGQSDIIIDYATARRREEPFSTAVTESTVQGLLHRRMNAQQQMRWTPRGAHLMLKVRCVVMNGSLQHDHAVAEGRAHRPFRRAALPPRFETVSAPVYTTKRPDRLRSRADVWGLTGECLESTLSGSGGADSGDSRNPPILAVPHSGEAGWRCRSQFGPERNGCFGVTKSG